MTNEPSPWYNQRKVHPWTLLLREHARVLHSWKNEFAGSSACNFVRAKVYPSFVLYSITDPI
ncbi:hypothetical protein PsorP6_001528 [Peronosclerospora sorghi]|uniref:Uncharacterized protein n=1 Tax=Peronosclerospora sorghi TaxID=230839 RepID=A0ACC0WQC9_9STRA|nr:hypothetical protein PsorP6_001528 [Peronosclerospora sorghi]